MCSLFEKQTNEYKTRILGEKECFGIEAASSMGWTKFVKEKNFIGMKTFGASAPYKELYKYYGITSENLIKLIKKSYRK